MRMQLSSWSFTRLALATSLTGLLAGFGGSFLITPRYSSSAEMMIKAGDFDAPVPPHGNLTEYFMQLENEVLSRTSLSSVIQDPRLDLYKRDRAVLPLEDVIEAMRKRSVRIEPALSPGLTGNDTFSFNVRFDYPDPHKAQQVVQALIAQFQKINRERQRETVQAKQTFDNDAISLFDARIATLERKLGIPPEQKPRFIDTFQRRLQFNSAINVEVLDPPSLPERKAYPNRAVISLLGMAAGFMLAMLLTLFRRTVPPAVPFPA